MLFRWGDFASNAGLTLPFKIELDALDADDWACLAKIVAREFVFSAVEGVPIGGLRFAEALRPYRSVNGRTLIVDDVLTTGDSMERHRANRDAFGVVVFSRGQVPHWITPIFRLNPLIASLKPHPD